MTEQTDTERRVRELVFTLAAWGTTDGPIHDERVKRVFSLRDELLAAIRTQAERITKAEQQTQTWMIAASSNSREADFQRQRAQKAEADLAAAREMDRKQQSIMDSQAQTISKLVADLTAARRVVEAAEMIRPFAHSAHFDPTGQGGLGCLACQDEAATYHTLREALAAYRTQTGTGGRNETDHLD
jgi:hypothetical protein